MPPVKDPRCTIDPAEVVESAAREGNIMEKSWKRRIVSSALTAILAGSSLQAGFMVTFYSSSSYSQDTAAMDATLGITGYLVESFESTALLPGLTISLDGSPPLTSLPNVYIVNPVRLTADNQWDGSAAATNGLNNQVGSYSDLITFAYAAGAGSFGVGLGSFQSANSPLYAITNHSLLINGVLIGEIETLAGVNWDPGVVRNGYLRIDATDGDIISSVGFLNNNAAASPAQQDFLLFDRLAIRQPESEPPGPVPEPSMALPLAAGLTVCAWRMLRRGGIAP